GVVLAGLFAAVMSTLDSGINSLAAVVAYDWLGGQKLSVTGSRLLTLVFGATIVAAAVVVPAIAEHVIDIIAGIAGTFLGLLLGLFVLGMFFPRANTLGAAIGLFAGIICWPGRSRQRAFRIGGMEPSRVSPSLWWVISPVALRPHQTPIKPVASPSERKKGVRSRA
ncbi:MAG TPA: hypothetical protein PKI05_14065, partial [Thermogutta sp.]|nr:hypothetical protein [Thermogutta sp.]